MMLETRGKESAQLTGKLAAVCVEPGEKYYCACNKRKTKRNSGVGSESFTQLLMILL